MNPTELDLQAVRASFDRAAEHYDRHALLQHAVEQNLLERLAYFDLAPARLLDLGCGTGIGSLALAGRYPTAQVLGLDWAPGMLVRLRQRARQADNVVAVCGDMRNIPLPARSVDLVFSNLAIQWCPALREPLDEIRRVLRPGGLFLFTTLGPDTLHELRAAWARVDDHPHVNHFTDLQEVGDRLMATGFRNPVVDAERVVLQYRDVLDLMRDLKAIGAHNAARFRPPGLTGRGKLRGVLDAYEGFRTSERYPATYEVLYGAAFAPAEGQPVRKPGGGEVAEFAVETLLKRDRRS